MKTIYNYSILIFSCLTFQKLHAQPAMKWTFLAIKSPEYKEYVVSKLSTNPELKYIAYCETHQGIFLKYNSSIYTNPQNLFTELSNSDPKLSEILVPKSNIDDEAEVLNLMTHCDFDETNGTAIKEELNKNQ